jgi:hypothetical protein
MARHMSSGTRRAPGQLRAALADGLNWRRGIRSRAAVSIAGSTINRWVLPEQGGAPAATWRRRRGRTGYGARAVCDLDRCRPQWPACQVKRSGCRETRPRFEQRAWFLRMWTAGLRGDKDQRPVSCRQSGPALSNGTARLQDDEIVSGRNAGGQFRSRFNLMSACLMQPNAAASGRLGSRRPGGCDSL